MIALKRFGPKYYIGQLLYAKRSKKGLLANQEYIVQNVYKDGKDTYVDVLYVIDNIVLLDKSVKLFRNKKR